MITNFFPLKYTFLTRIKSKGERISWVLIYPLFLLFVAYISGFPLFYTFCFFIVTMQVYEVGYVYNDIVTTKKEKNPTVRLTGDTNWIEDNLILVTSIKLLSAFFTIFLLCDMEQFFLISVSLVMILVTYYFHNTIRNKCNVITYFFLVSLRYLTPLIVFLDIQIALFIILSFPFVRTLEHACKTKYGFKRLSRLIRFDVDLFRVLYYGALFFIVFCLDNHSETKYYIAYFLVVRLLAFFVSNFGFFKRNDHGSY
ncbi:hypothetical protein CWN98_12570 [Vibrio splendidus]|nr:hypothetical protein CWN98_12570 [Vibrio splendidus]PTP47538.1 hypothetical protein CWO10_12035 [Vibrio splendidus]